jgi:hypothetical protein
VKKLETTLDSKISLELFENAHIRARRGKRRRPEILTLEQDRQAYLFMIMDAVANETYLPSAYREFWIHDPKKRLVLALSYVDRIVHQWYIEEFIKPYFVPRFISTSYACIPKCGTHAAINKTQNYLRAMYRHHPDGFYIIKMDISKFFNNIDKEIMYDLLRKRMTDPKLIRLTRVILFDNNGYRGLPIGNYTSQYFANIYLNELDQFVKRQLKVRRYLRYMDDLVLMVANKQTAREVFNEIEQFLAKELRLKLNPKSRYYKDSAGVDFAGARIFKNRRLLRKRSKSRLKGILSDYKDDQDLWQFDRRLNSWLGHAMHLDASRYTNKVLMPEIAPYKELFPRFIELS